MKSVILTLLCTLLTLSFSCIACSWEKRVQQLQECRTDSCTPSPKSIRLLFTGDLMQHQTQIDAARSGQSYSYTSCFEKVTNQIKKADIAVGNLEVTLGGKPYSGYPQFSAPDEFLDALIDAGFDMLTTANNHCLDRGKQGLERTAALLASRQMPYAGTYKDSTDRARLYPLLMEKNGFRIAFLTYTYGTNGIRPTPPNQINYIDKAVMAADIRKAEAMNPDVIIALMHWGIEYATLPDQDQRDLADWLFEQGVDHIIGSHPHVVQPIEVRRDKDGNRHLLVYSLGNYISNMSKRGTDGGLMITLDLEKDSVAYLKDCSYSLVWTGKPVTTGKKNFQLYPANTPADSLNASSRLLMNRFLNDSRNLFKEHNRGISELLFEQE